MSAKLMYVVYILRVHFIAPLILKVIYIIYETYVWFFVLSRVTREQLDSVECNVIAHFFV